MSKKRVRKASWKPLVAKSEYLREWVDGRQYCLVRLSVGGDRYPQAYIPFGKSKMTVPSDLLGKRVELVLRVSKR